MKNKGQHNALIDEHVRTMADVADCCIEDVAICGGFHFTRLRTLIFERLHFTDGLTYNEIGEAFNFERSTICNNVNRMTASDWLKKPYYREIRKRFNAQCDGLESRSIKDLLLAFAEASGVTPNENTLEHYTELITRKANE